MIQSNMSNEFNIKILKSNNRNFACYNPHTKCMYIRKPVKEIDNYIDYSIDIINHEYNHYILSQEIDEHTSFSYDSDICLKVEDRKMLTFEVTKSLHYDKKR